MGERELTFTYGRRCKFKTRKDVVSFEVWVLSEYIFYRLTGGQLSKNGADRDSKATNARHAAHLVGVDSYSIGGHAKQYP